MASTWIPLSFKNSIHFSQTTLNYSTRKQSGIWMERPLKLDVAAMQWKSNYKRFFVCFFVLFCFVFSFFEHPANEYRWEKGNIRRVEKKSSSINFLDASEMRYCAEEYRRSINHEGNEEKEEEKNEIKAPRWLIMKRGVFREFGSGSFSAGRAVRSDLISLCPHLIGMIDPCCVYRFQPSDEFSSEIFGEMINYLFRKKS